MTTTLDSGATPWPAGPGIVPRRQKPRPNRNAGRYAFAAMLLALAAGAFALRLYQLDVQPFWADEGFTGYHARLPLPDLMREIIVVDHHPPLHYLILNAWQALAGSTEFALRYVSVFAGTLSVIVLGVLGGRTMGRATGLVAAGLMAVSPFAVWFSQEARMYALLMLLVLLSMLLAWLAATFQTGPDPRSHRTAAALWFGYGLVLTGALFSHYYGLFAAPIAGVLVLAARPDRQTLTRWAVASGAAGLLFLAWVPALLNQASDMGGGGGPALWPWQTIGSLFSTWSVGEYASYDASILVVMAFVLLAMLGLVEMTVRDRRGVLAAWLVTWTLVPPIVAWSASAILGMELRATGQMYYLFALPGFLLMVARGVAAATLHITALSFVGAAAIALVAVPSLLTQFNDVPKEDFRSTAALVSTRVAPGDAVMLHAESLYPAFDYYYRARTPWIRAAVSDPAATDAWVREALAGTERVWLVLSHTEISDPNEVLVSWFERNTTRLEERWLDGIRVLSFAMEPRPRMDAPSVRLERRANFANGISLMGYELTTFDPSRHYLPVKFFWQNLQPQDTTYRLVVQLVDSRGTIWSQVDRTPISGSYPTTRWERGEYLTDRFDLPLPPGLPPLTYELRAFMYDQRDGRRVSVTAETGAAPTSDVVVTRVTTGVLRDYTRQELEQSVDRVIDQPLGDLARLIGATVPTTPVDPGQTVDLALLWDILRNAPQSTQVRLRLTNSQTGERTDVPLFDQEDPYQPIRWTANQVVRSLHRITVPASLESGTYQVSALLRDTARPNFEATTPISLLTVSAPERVFDAQPWATRSGAVFGNVVELTSYQGPTGPVPPGGRFAVGLQWKALAPMRTSYSVFVHVLDESGRIVAQSDGVPGDKPRATNTWQRGEIITEQRTLALPPNLPPGTYRIVTGLYNPQDGTRLPLASGPAGQPLDRVQLNQGLVVR